MSSNQVPARFDKHILLLFTVRTTLFPSNARPGSASTNNNVVGQQPSRMSNDASSPVQQQQKGQRSNGTDPQTDTDNSDTKNSSIPAPADSTPSPSEIAAIKRQCAAEILSLIPKSIARAFFGGGAKHRANNDTTNNRNESSHGELPPSTVNGSSRGSSAATNHTDENKDDKTEELLEAIERDLLDPFSDAYCNKHLIYAIVELFLIKLMPELSEHSISGLMEERGIVS
ncbi:conserved hypothetical protein [Talaromyces stipitatus ATCC 10500]|uniref:PXA domain-containing protein n=1 Tax=Talaromyces stipitatus (strain ATCC 10500 / CBS 375.48 / QM 6759 / NRRL 1006) TaxID=441959 RepID=B8M5X4_TALSN|nr:uncharacterized protein TSTA_033440 [Talaromyces stipitatus ATCC 10500]EED20101.1 conserved hypothetical protein [Talaromyces stipitatus ATCC 10500]